MGCSSSKLTVTEHLDRMNHLFKVVILTPNGHDGTAGKLEITLSELILYQKQEPTITRWPLTGLRHYGFNDDLFSFESGRRCPSGKGIFAFRCRSAETLYNVLQEKIRYTAEQNIRLLASNRLAAINQAAMLAQFRDGVAVDCELHGNRSPSSVHNYTNTMLDYMNTIRDYENSVLSPIFYADLDLPATNRPTPSRAERAPKKRHSLYVNIPSMITTTTPVKPSGSTSASKRQALNRRSCYENRACVGKDEFDMSETYRGRHCRAASMFVLPRSQSCKTPRSASKRVTRDGSNSIVGSVNDASCYTAIDFERTNALSGRKLSVAADEGIRKTRHSVAAEAMDLLWFNCIYLIYIAIFIRLDYINFWKDNVRQC